MFTAVSQIQQSASIELSVNWAGDLQLEYVEHRGCSSESDLKYKKIIKYFACFYFVL